MSQDMRKIFKVSSGSNIHNLAKALHKSYLEGADLEIQAIGGGAVNQAIKAFILCRGKLALVGKDVALIPGFRDVSDTRDANEEKTISAINFKLVEL
jgi:stage V sporulation protein S